MVTIETVIRSLSRNRVEYVIVGGIAFKAHSSGYVTFDFNCCYLRSEKNLECIIEALSPFKPRPRNFPSELPFSFELSTLRNGTNLTFETTIGEVLGIGDFPEVFAHSQIFPLYGFDVNILSIDGLIIAKRAAGRTKDLLVLPELEALQEALNEEED